MKCVLSPVLLLLTNRINNNVYVQCIHTESNYFLLIFTFYIWKKRKEKIIEENKVLIYPKEQNFFKPKVLIETRVWMDNVHYLAALFLAFFLIKQKSHYNSMTLNCEIVRYNLNEWISCYIITRIYERIYI